MNIFNIVIVVFLIIASTVFYNSIKKAAQIENKNIKPEMKSVCYSDDLTCIPNVDCSLFNPATIQRCTMDENGKKICNSCICQANSKLRGCMKCQESDPSVDGKRYEFNKSRNDCKPPLQWDENTQTCVLSKGTFCLPTKINNPPCNKFTGRKLLVYDNEGNSGYSWQCFCKDNTKFSGIECDNINVCGLIGSKQNPKNFSPNSQMGNYRGLRKKGEPNVYWTGSSNWDPLNPEDTECQCKYGEIVDNKRRLCLPNDCKPGIPKATTTPGEIVKNCECPRSFIDCQSIAYSADGALSQYYNGVCKIPSCVPDPCGGPYGEDGSYNVQTGKCVCSPGFSLVPDPYSFTGQSCKKLCVNNGPCGNRGTCVVNLDKKGYKRFIIRCIQNIQNPEKCQTPLKFFIIYNDNNRDYYLNYNNSDKTLSFNTTETNGKFSIEAKNSSFVREECENNNCSKILTITLQNDRGKIDQKGYYYLKLGDLYVSLIPDSNGKHSLVDSSKIDEASFRLMNPYYQYPNTTASIYIEKSVKFLSVKKESDTLKVVFDPYTDRFEYCDPCFIKKGWAQDDNLLCGNTCISNYNYSPEYIQSASNLWKISNPNRVLPEKKPTDEEMKKACCSGKYTSKEQEKTCSVSAGGSNCSGSYTSFQFQCVP